MTRIKESFGKCHFNPGKILVLSEAKYKVDYSRRFFLFDIVPMGAVRMTQRDRMYHNPNHPDPKKRQRISVGQYFAFKNLLSWQAKKMGYVLGDYLDAVYFSPMPDSWSEKKKDRMNGLPCKVKPDTDNITKAIKDTLRKNDSNVWYEKAEHRWATFGSILIYG